VMEDLRSSPPDGLLGQRLVEVSDALIGEKVDLESGARTGWNLPKSNVLGWRFANGTILLARPSGTEPKLKFYAYVRETVDTLDQLASAEANAQQGVQAWLQAVVQRTEAR